MDMQDINQVHESCTENCLGKSSKICQKQVNSREGQVVNVKWGKLVPQLNYPIEIEVPSGAHDQSRGARIDTFYLMLS